MDGWMDGWMEERKEGRKEGRKEENNTTKEGRKEGRNNWIKRMPGLNEAMRFSWTSKGRMGTCWGAWTVFFLRCVSIKIKTEHVRNTEWNQIRYGGRRKEGWMDGSKEEMETTKRKKEGRKEGRK